MGPTSSSSRAVISAVVSQNTLHGCWTRLTVRTAGVETSAGRGKETSRSLQANMTRGVLTDAEMKKPPEAKGGMGGTGRRCSHWRSACECSPSPVHIRERVGDGMRQRGSMGQSGGETRSCVAYRALDPKRHAWQPHGSASSGKGPACLFKSAKVRKRHITPPHDGRHCMQRGVG